MLDPCSDSLLLGESADIVHTCVEGFFHRVLLPDGSSWMDANRGPGGLDPDHPGSPSSFSEVAQREIPKSAVSRIQAPK